MLYVYNAFQLGNAAAQLLLIELQLKSERAGDALSRIDQIARLLHNSGAVNSFYINFYLSD